MKYKLLLGGSILYMPENIFKRKNIKAVNIMKFLKIINCLKYYIPNKV